MKKQEQQKKEKKSSEKKTASAKTIVSPKPVSAAEKQKTASKSDAAHHSSPAPGSMPNKENVSFKKYTPRLKEKYFFEIIPSFIKDFNFKSPMRVPRLEKIAINQGIGDAAHDKKIIDAAVGEISVITGQKPVITLAKKDISNFKIRKGNPVGIKVTLRSNRMYEFLDRFISTALPRIRDFRGISKYGFDGRGNYTLGITEQIIFPEINIDKINKVRGMDITFVINARNNAEAMTLLKHFGMPFKKEEDEEKREKKKIVIPTVAVKEETKPKIKTE